MEKLKKMTPSFSPFNSREITILAAKLKHVALNTPLRFSVQALRPHSKSAARFGNLSHHSFFSRHNPHPHRVTHIQGLNGAPVCTVNDEWSQQILLPTSVLGVPGLQMPIGDPQPIPVPRLSVSSLSDTWREQLRVLAAKVRTVSSSAETEKEGMYTLLHLKTAKARRETQYSEETGRLIPPSSQATTRHSSHRLQRNKAQSRGRDGLTFQDQELIVLELLSQILQTDSLRAIQQWLLTATQREKDIVMSLLQIATACLHLERQELATTLEEKLPSQLSQDSMGNISKLHSFGRNQSTRPSAMKQKHDAITEEEQPVQIGTAEVLQLDEKPSD